MIKMPFGKHKDLPLNEVPEDYLRWVLGNCDRINPTLKEAIRKQLGLDENDKPKPAPAMEDAPEDLKPRLKSWYRKLAKEFHPDRRGGSDEAMIAINRAKQLLFESLGMN